MLRRLSNTLILEQLITLEAVLIGLFWVQALRFLVGAVYSRLASASLISSLDPRSIDPAALGVVQPATASSEVSFLIYMLALPLLIVLIGQMRWTLVGAAVVVCVGRYMMNDDTTMSSTMAAALTLGSGLAYIGAIIRQRAQVLPYLFVLAIGADQLFRAVGNTLDPSWSSEYKNVQIGLSIFGILLALINSLRKNTTESPVSNDTGLLSIWGGIGLGAMLFLQFSLLALPNAVAARAGTDYTLFVPPLMAATLLPLVPFIRRQARSFIALFDGNVRGWSWMLLTTLLVVFGTRFQGIIAGAALVIAQFIVSLMWWWLVRPQAEKERNFTGLWLVLTMFVFATLVVFDNFTYDYAFVRDFSQDLAFLNRFIPPLLRGFRGMGLAVLLLCIFLAALPMIQTRRRIPWTGSRGMQSAGGLFLVVIFTIGAARAAQPPQVEGVFGQERIRIGTYNIHSGYNEFFYYDLEGIARTIQQSGAVVILLQEVETGRMTSFGVDQVLWLARRLGMDARFFPTNEGLQGLAVLSKVEIVFNDGYLLTSTSNQTGLQRVQVRPDAGVVNIYNTWLGYLVEGTDADLDDSEQQRQLSEIFAIIASHYPEGRILSGRTVIGGTFNNVPDSPLIERMKSTGLTDPFAGQPIEVSATLRRTGIRARFDYIWLGNLGSIGAGVMNTSSSDHRMAVTELMLTR